MTLVPIVIRDVFAPSAPSQASEAPVAPSWWTIFGDPELTSLERQVAAENLDVDDFECRYLIVDDIWIPLGETLLIGRFKQRGVFPLRPSSAPDRLRRRRPCRFRRMSGKRSAAVMPA